jgi:hypothetical protein
MNADKTNNFPIDILYFLIGVHLCSSAAKISSRSLFSMRLQFKRRSDSLCKRALISAFRSDS